jgi:hypothetical protein
MSSGYEGLSLGLIFYTLIVLKNYMNKKDKAGPTFIIGRPHSGNTMLAEILGNHTDLSAFKGEDHFFEKSKNLERIKNDSRRVKKMIEQITGGMDSTASNEVKDSLINKVESENLNNNSIYEMYKQGKNYIAHKNNSKNWVQKATSYIFYINDIRRKIPEAKFIFVVRNPMDLAASKKRREAKEKWVRTIWGWSRGVKNAIKFGKDLKDSFLLVRYEDIVSSPETEIRNILSFLDLEFQSSLIKVPHVNRSETPYNKVSNKSGLNSDRVFYFVDELKASEIASVRWLVNEDLLQEVYPDLPVVDDAGAIETLTQVANVIFSGMAHLIRDQGSLVLTEPRRALSRLRLRLFSDLQNSE